MKTKTNNNVGTHRRLAERDTEHENKNTIVEEEEICDEKETFERWKSR